METGNERRISFLEKQNEALLKALAKRAEQDGNAMLSMLIEQQKQILSLSQKVTVLVDRSRWLASRLSKIDK